MKNNVIKTVALILCLVSVVCFVTACGNKAPRGYVKSIEFDLIECDEIGVVKMKTNLPTGTELSIRVVNGSKNCDVTADATVQLIENEKYIISQPIKDKDGKYLTDGTYTAFVQTKSASEQPEKVQSELGAKCESLTGGNVYADDDGKFAKVIRSFIIENGKYKDGKKSD